MNTEVKDLFLYLVIGFEIVDANTLLSFSSPYDFSFIRVQSRLNSSADAPDDASDASHQYPFNLERSLMELNDDNSNQPNFRMGSGIHVDMSSINAVDAAASLKAVDMERGGPSFPIKSRGAGEAIRGGGRERLTYRANNSGIAKLGRKSGSIFVDDVDYGMNMDMGIVTSGGDVYAGFMSSLEQEGERADGSACGGEATEREGTILTYEDEGAGEGGRKSEIEAEIMAAYEALRSGSRGKVVSRGVEESQNRPPKGKGRKSAPRKKGAGVKQNSKGSLSAPASSSSTKATDLSSNSHKKNARGGKQFDNAEISATTPAEIYVGSVKVKNAEHALALINRKESSWCKCRKSKCLKLYCDCFQAGTVCKPGSCGCVDCLNLKEHSGKGGLRTNAIMNALVRRSDAFEKRIKKVGNGCGCKNSGCLKKYCECFRAGTSCDEKICKCKGCKNSYGSKHQNGSVAGADTGASPTKKAPDVVHEEETNQHAAKKNKWGYVSGRTSNTESLTSTPNKSTVAPSLRAQTRGASSKAAGSRKRKIGCTQ